ALAAVIQAMRARGELAEKNRVGELVGAGIQHDLLLRFAIQHQRCKPGFVTVKDAACSMMHSEISSRQNRAMVSSSFLEEHGLVRNSSTGRGVSASPESTIIL